MSKSTTSTIGSDFWDVVQAGARGASLLRQEGRHEEANGITEATLVCVRIACGERAPWAS